jgi:DNA repair protein SbcD/Mre11
MPRILHTADWHLGKRLFDFRLLDAQRQALAGLLDVIDAELPDLVVLAGDVFDAPVPPVGALQAWGWIAEAIVDERGVPLVVIPGNHDSAERIAMNANVARRSGLFVLHELATAHRPVRVGGIDVVALPFHKPPHVRALADAASGDGASPAAPVLGDFDYDAAIAWLLRRARTVRDPAVPTVLVAHAFVAGGGEEDAGEDPLMVGGAGAVTAATLAGFDYVALGHLPVPRALAGHPSARYAGSLYPYAFGEANDKSVTIVDLADQPGLPATIRTAPLPTQPRVRLVEGISFDQAIEDGLRASAAGDPAVADYLLLRVTDRAPIDHALARLREVYPHALLEQPVVDVPVEARCMPGDARTLSVEDAFLAFYRHVFDAPPGEVERDVLREALTADPVEAGA